MTTYKVEQRLRFVRQPLGFTGEGETRPRSGHEPDSHTALRDSYFIPLERMQKCDDDLAQFSKIRMMAQVHFGPDAAKPFDIIIGAYREVAIAARMLMSTAGGRRGQNVDSWEAAIWNMGESDELSKRVSEAVREIEALCRPHLK